MRNDLLIQTGDFLFLLDRTHLNIGRHCWISTTTIDRRLIKKRIHAEVITLANRVELMVVATATIKGQPHPYRAYRFSLIKYIFHAIFCCDAATFAVDHVVTIEARRQHLLLRCIRQQITGDLFHGKVVVRLIGIEGANHPITPRPHGAFAITLIPIAIGIPCGLQPIPCHALTITR